ncbi:MAG: hypothetical protein FJ100_23170 [Deltaproteobacteria bacterium]|nr:hypothetical protein [Deltaproteobacteria bacterium]
MTWRLAALVSACIACSTEEPSAPPIQATDVVELGAAVADSESYLFGSSW